MTNFSISSRARLRLPSVSSHEKGGRPSGVGSSTCSLDVSEYGSKISNDSQRE